MVKRSIHCLLGGRWWLAVFAVLLLSPRPLVANPPGGDQASDAPIRFDGPLTEDVQRALAERFAPTLVYHRFEKYFPTSPLFSLEHEIRFDGGGDDAAPLARLGTVEQRRMYYESLTPKEKAAMARVFYRVYSSRLGKEPVVVLEYWLYYVQNEYRVRGNLFPVWLDGNHPNDLEHVHVVLHRDADGHYALFEVDGSAHTGTMPANRHQFDSDEQPPPHTRVIVELGSHANAPDANGDGMFTPGPDGSSGYKLLWGIRDRGITWARYHPAYMDARVGANAVVFDVAGDDDERDHLNYQLVPVSDLESAFSRLAFTPDERREAFEMHRSWFRRAFGGDNGSSSKLLVPPPRDPGEDGIGIERFASTERGFLVGTQLNMEQQGGLVGARYAFLLGGTYVPDVMLQADAIVSRHHRFVTGQAFVTYPLDGSTTLMFGRAVVFEAVEPDRRQWDWVAAIEFPLGHMRVYFASRSWGPLTKYSKEVRLSYFFK